MSAAQSQKKDQKLDTAVLLDAPNVPQMVVDSDGTPHFGPRTVPLPALESLEARQAYTRQMLQRAQVSAARGGLASVRTADASAPEPNRSKATALKIYPVVEESQKIGGVSVTIYSPKVIPPKNRNKVAMEFEMDAEAIAVASLGHMKVIKVNYRGGGPSVPGNEDIVAVYRELLNTHKAKNIGMFGASGGCTLAQTTVVWLPQQKLPLPGAVGLGTCSGGSNPGDARYTMNGLDAGLSSAFSGQPPVGGRNTTPRKPGEPPVPLALFRSVDRPIATVMRPNHFIYVRDDAPDGFAYAVAKALAEHRQLFQVQLEPWHYDPDTVG